MAHLLDSMFSVREVPWHGLGHVLDEYPENWDAARKLAGLDWEPVESPVYAGIPDFKLNEVGEIEPYTRYEVISGYKHLVRSDNGGSLDVADETYTVFPNADMGPLLEAIADQSGGRYEYETAGALDEGRKVWVLLRAAEPFMVPGDPNGAVLPYISLQNSHDGSGSLRAQRLRTRIVCRNTSHAADLEAERHGLQFVFRHTKSMLERVDFAKRVLAGMATDQVLAQEWAADLLKIEVTERQTRAFVEMFIPSPLGEVATKRVQNNIDEARKTVYGYLNSRTCEGISHTAYGLVQAAIEYADHGRKARNAETKFARSVLRPEPMKAAAERLARQAALV